MRGADIFGIVVLIVMGFVMGVAVGYAASRASVFTVLTETNATCREAIYRTWTDEYKMHFDDWKRFED